MILFEVFIGPKICNRKIYNHINDLGGQVLDIEKLSMREKLYCVNYTLNGKSEKSIVRFDIFYEDIWK
jgi:hypothetical protein